MSITIRENKDIVNAGLHVTTVNALLGVVNDLLDPIAKRALDCAARGDYTLIRTCLERFPQGFHRTELRVYCNQNGIQL